MPPKPKCTRQQIIDAAITLIKDGGESNLNARAVAAQLGTTVSPIFTLFSGMDELKNAAREAVKKACFADLSEAMRCTPAFKAFGLRFVRFATHEPHLFHLIFADGSPRTLHTEIIDFFAPLLDEVSDTFGISHDDAVDLLDQMFIISCGLAFSPPKDETGMTDEQIGKLLSEACIGHVMFMRTRAGTFDEALLGEMAAGVTKMPVPKENA